MYYRVLPVGKPFGRNNYYSHHHTYTNTMSRGPSRKVTKSQIIQFFHLSDRTVMTTDEIHSEVSETVNKRVIQSRLNELADDDKLNKKGGTGVVWWLNTDNVYLTDLAIVDGAEDGEILRKTLNWPIQLSIKEIDALLSVDIPGDDAQVIQRRKAILRVYLYLRENQEASKREIINELYSEYNCGYENENSWWQRLIRPGLKEFPHITDAARGGKWEYPFSEDVVSKDSYDLHRAERKPLEDPHPLDLESSPTARNLIKLILKHWYPDKNKKHNWRRTSGRRILRILSRKKRLTVQQICDICSPRAEYVTDEEFLNEVVEPVLSMATDAGYVEQQGETYISRMPNARDH